MENKLKNYIENDLRTRLYLPEKFEIYHNKPESRVIIETDRPSVLFSILINNANLRIEFKNKVISFLRELYPDVRDIFIDIKKGNTAMIINYNIRQSSDIGFSDIGNVEDIGIYANIISKLPEDKLADFCKSDKNLLRICKNNSLWIEVIKVRFPEYLAITNEDLNWREIYRGLLYFKKLKEYEGQYKKFIFKDNKGRITNYSWEEFIKDYPNTMKYLIYNKKGELSEADLINIVDEIINVYPNKYNEIIFYILDNYNLTKQVIEDIVYMMLDSYQIPLMEKAIEYYKKNNLDYRNELEDMMGNLIGSNNYSDVNPNVYVYIAKELGIELTPQYLLDQLDVIDFENLKLIEKILELLPNGPEYKDIIMNKIEDMIEDVFGYADIIIALFNKIKHHVNKDDIRRVIDILEEKIVVPIHLGIRDPNLDRYYLDRRNQLINYFKNELNN